jgi:hypothetical protein
MQSWPCACVAVSGVRSAEGWQLGAGPYRTYSSSACREVKSCDMAANIACATQRRRVSRGGTVDGVGAVAESRFGGRSMGRAVTPCSRRCGIAMETELGGARAQSPWPGTRLAVGWGIDEADVVFVGAVVSVFQLLISDQSRRVGGVPQEKWTVMRAAVLDSLESALD